MRDQFLNEMMIVVVSSFVLFIPVWLLLWIVLPRLDRRPKDSVRCGACWYDLRATTLGNCPECGADLEKTKVWPIGKPSRGKLIHFLMAWLWVSLIGTLVASNLYSEYKSRLVMHYTIDQDVAILAQPKSSTHDAAFITLSGQRWVFLPNSDESPKIPASWASIHILSSGVTVLSVAIDLDTMTYMPHPLPHVEKTQAGIRQDSQIELPYGAPVTAEALAEFHPLGLDQVTDGHLILEMSLLIDALAAIDTDIPLRWSEEKSDAFAAKVRPDTGANSAYAITRGTGSSYSWDTEQAPIWTTFFVLGSGVLVSAFGIFLIRRWCYRRDTAEWNPER